MEVASIPREVSVSRGAQKMRMVLFCRNSGKLNLERSRVTTRARVRTRRETRAVTRKV